MNVLQKIRERLYRFFYPSEEECRRYFGWGGRKEMTPEEREEYDRQVEALYKRIDEAYPSKEE